MPFSASFFAVYGTPLQGFSQSFDWDRMEAPRGRLASLHDNRANAPTLRPFRFRRLVIVLLVVRSNFLLAR
jgi:hypothetical protein